MNSLDKLFDKKYAKYKHRLHHVYMQLYRTQIYTEYLSYKKQRYFHINDGILKINALLKKINRYNSNSSKIAEELSKITNKNKKQFLIFLFLKIYSSWKYLKNHGFVFSHMSNHTYANSLARIWRVKKKKYINYIRRSFGRRRYTRRYLMIKGFPMKTLDDVRCWLFYFKKIGKTNLAVQLYKKEFLYFSSQTKKNTAFDLNKYLLYFFYIFKKRISFVKEQVFHLFEKNYRDLMADIPVWFSFTFFYNQMNNFSDKKITKFLLFLSCYYKNLFVMFKNVLQIERNNVMPFINYNMKNTLASLLKKTFSFFFFDVKTIFNINDVNVNLNL
jgi:hypothetical protein